MRIEVTFGQVELLSSSFGGFDARVSYDGQALVVTDEALAADIADVMAGDGWEDALRAAHLAGVKARAKTAIDAAAEAERLKYITGGAGQAMTYQRKLEEARAAVAEAEPDAEAYPLLAASVGIDGADVAAVAAIVIAMDAAWTVVGAAIEAARLGAKKAIDDAEDEAAVRAVQPVWPQP